MRLEDGGETGPSPNDNQMFIFALFAAFLFFSSDNFVGLY